jgi:hypothetical protein
MESDRGRRNSHLLDLTVDSCFGDPQSQRASACMVNIDYRNVTMVTFMHTEVLDIFESKDYLGFAVNKREFGV